MPSSEISVVFLVWGPLGTPTLERFAASYRARSGGTPHRLAVVFNGVEPSDEDAFQEALGDLQYESVHLSRRMLDLAAYIAAGRQLDSEYLCFLNSYSELLDDEWLAKMFGHLTTPGVGLVGASGSYESAATNAPLVARPFRRLQFPAFPNPHIRSNAFMLRCETMLALNWSEVRTKTAAWKLESGVHGISRQVRAMGLRALVVGRDGEAYDSDRYYESNTFRRGRQANLLVADNRTRQFDEANPERRRWLLELAWGKGAADAD